MSTYLRLDGVKGDSHAASFTGWIELASVSLGGGMPLATGASGAAGGAVTQMRCTGRMGSHSPELYRLSAEGKTVGGELVMTKDGTRFAQVMIKGAVVVSYVGGSGGGDVGMESFELNTLPFKVEYLAEGALLGTWNVTVGKWSGLFVFEGGGRVHWTERNGTSRHDGLWKKTASDIQWKFASPGDIRTFVIPLPLPAGKVSGRILPAGQGYFSMTRM